MKWLLWMLLALPLGAQPNDWPPMPESAKQRLLAWDRTGLLAELRSAAEKGDVAAMLYFGEANENLEGIPHDYGEAMKWYRAAAETQRWYRRALELGFRRTALRKLCLRWWPGPQPLAPVPELWPEEFQLLERAGLRGRLEYQGGGADNPFGLPARVVMVAFKRINKEVELESPNGEGPIIYLQREDRWEKLPPDARTSPRKLRLAPQEPDHPEYTMVWEEREGGGLTGGSAFVWKRR